MAINPYQTKKGKRYRAVIKVDCQRITKRGFLTKRQAREWMTDTRRAIEEQRGELIGLSLAELANAYLDSCEGRFRANTLRQKDYVFSQFLGMHGNIQASNVQGNHIADYLAHIREHTKGDPNKTANRHLRDLKALFNWALRQEQLAGQIRHNPCKFVQAYPEETKERYVPPSEDIKAVLLAASPWETDILQILLQTGARIGEVFPLTWDDINMEHRTIRLWTRKRRGGQLQPRLAPMTDTLHGIFQRLWKNRDKLNNHVWINPQTGKPFHKNNHAWKYFMARICSRAKVKPFTFHALRHFVACLLEDSGKATLSDIQRLLGHQRVTTTEIYLRSLRSDLTHLTSILDERAPQGGTTNLKSTKKESSG